MPDDLTETTSLVSEPAALSPAAEKIRVMLEQAKSDRQYRERSFTKKAEADFLGLFASGMPVHDACQMLQISSATLYLRRKLKPEFAELWEEARERRYLPVEDRLADIAMTGEPSSMATVRAAEVLLKGSGIARYNSAPRQTASATVKQTAEGGQLSVSIGTPGP